MSRLIFNRQNLARLYHTVNSQPPQNKNWSRRPPAARVAGKRYSLPQAQRAHEARPRQLNHDPSRSFEPFPFIVTEENKVEMMRRAITPLYDTPYEEQLNTKDSYCRNALRELARELYREGTPVRLDVSRLPCQVNRIVASPQIHNYRNSDELSIWYGHDGKTITAGHHLFPINKHGDTVTVEPNGNNVSKESVIKLADILQDFLRTQTERYCLSLGDQGGWRQFRLITNADDDLMLLGIINPRALKVSEVIEERDKFKDFVLERSMQEGLKLASIYYQPCPNSRCQHEMVPYELLWGDEVLVDSIGEFKIKILPDCRLHYGPVGMQMLLQTMRKTLEECFMKQDDRAEVISQKPIILNINSSIGLFSIAFADLAEQVIGIESSARAVDTAVANAKLNGITNCEFINSNLEIVIERVLEKYRCSSERREIVLVGEIPPSGMYTSVIDTIRRCGAIKKAVLSVPKIMASRCLSNIVGLCLDKGRHSVQPFAPIQATPLDTSPMTDSVCTVLALERLP